MGGIFVPVLSLPSGEGPRAAQTKLNIALGSRMRL